MGGPRIVVRILGLASTTRGFGFAVTEGPRRLVASGLHRVPVKTSKAVKAIDGVLRRAKPLFVAFDREAALKKRRRGRLFADAVTKACDAHGVMILDIANSQIRALTERPRPTKLHIAEVVVRFFPELARSLPARRKPWQSEDDRIGLFMALAAAVTAWHSFGRPRG